MPRARLLIVLLLVAATIVVGEQIHYGVGMPASPKEVRARDITVLPDGTGLPGGHGTAEEGKAVFQAKCASCHGEQGQGTADFPALVGGRGTLSGPTPDLTIGSYWPYATTVWDYIRRAMPYQKPGSLTCDQVYSVTAYILFLNKIVGEHEELNKEALPKIQMPNRNGFVPDSRPDVK